MVYTCVSGFFLTYTFLHILTHPYTSIHIQVYCGLFGSCFRTMTSYDMKPNRIRMTRRTPLVIRGCSILRPFGQQLSHFIFSKLRLSNPNLKNIIKFSSAAKKFEENLRNKGFFNTKNKNAKRNDEEKTAKIPFFSCSKKLKIT